MRVTFYNFTKKKNSTAQPSGGTSLECQLKQETSIGNPTFIINGWNAAYNYAYVPIWGRYYFVTDATYLTGQRVEVSCSVDVLATYKSNISDYTAFVERSATQFNVFVTDNLVSNTLDIVAQDHKISTFPSPFDRDTGTYMLRVVNHTSSSTGICTYALTVGQLSSFMDAMFSDGTFGDALSDEVTKTFFNPFQYVVSLMWVPVSIDAISGSSENIYFGWWDSGVSAIKVSGDYAGGVTSIINPVTIPENKYADFRKYHSAFSQYYLYLPCIGSVPISGSDIENGLVITLTIDIITGNAEYHLQEAGESGGVGTLIATYMCQMGVPVQIGQLNSMLNGVISGVGGVVGNLLNGNIGGAIASGVDSVQDVTSPTPSVNGTQGSKYMITALGRVDVTCLNYGTCDRPETVAGRPLYKNIKLSSLSGYIKCGAASVPIPGYDSEKDTLNNYLNSGFYLE